MIEKTSKLVDSIAKLLDSIKGILTAPIDLKVAIRNTLITAVVLLAIGAVGVVIYSIVDTTIFRQPKVRGSVVDTQGHGIKDAEVQLSSGRITRTTIGGVFDFNKVDPDPSQQGLTVTKDGNALAEGLFEIGTGRDVYALIIVNKP